MITNRREFLTHAGAGFGGLALSALLASQANAAPAFHQTTLIDPLNPFAPRRPHFAPKAKNVIFLFMYGGPSQVDLFDYKPLLAQLHGKPVPESFKKKDKVGGVFGACKDEL